VRRASSSGTLQSDRTDPLVADPQRHDQGRPHLRRADVAGIALHIGDVLQTPVLDDPGADPGPLGEGLTEVLHRRSHGCPDHHLPRRADRQQEAVVVAHRVADDPEQTDRELVDVEHRADL